LLLACLLYCLIAPNQYEASAKVALRTSPVSALSLEAPDPFVSASTLSAPVQEETLANVFRSDQLAWKVITGLKLYQAPGFMGRFASKFPDFRAEAPAADAQEWLLERFQRRLRVQTLPRTLLIEIRFRCRDAALSASVVNALIRAYGEQDTEARVLATAQASTWLESQLKELKVRVDQDQQRLAAFQREHGLLNTPQTLADGKQGETEHTSTVLEIDELGRQLVAVSTDRILREAQYRTARQARRATACEATLCEPQANPRWTQLTKMLTASAERALPRGDARIQSGAPEERWTSLSWFCLELPGRKHDACGAVPALRRGSATEHAWWIIQE